MNQLQTLDKKNDFGLANLEKPFQVQSPVNSDHPWDSIKVVAIQRWPLTQV